MKTNIIIGQSGGPTAAINASLAGALSYYKDHQDEFNSIYGMKFGIEGLLKDRVIELNHFSTENLFNALLAQTPSASLGSCRYKLKNFRQDESEYKTIFSYLRKYQIGIFLYIGGNDSMDTISKLYDYAQFHNINDIQFIGIPKTIDNDLMGIDHTPGFGSGAKFVATVVSEIWHDAQVYDKESVTIIEIMGRNAGWLTASAALAPLSGCGGPDLIYLPEVPFSYEIFVEEVKEKVKERKKVIICVSEGIRDENGNYISEMADHRCEDKFGHIRMSGTAKVLELRLMEDTNFKIRSIELNVLQRCAGHIASARDLEEAKNLASRAIHYAQEGYSGGMSTLTRFSDDPYLIEYAFCDIQKVANIEKKIPLEWIDDKNKTVTKECIEYMKPLIGGEQFVIYDHGMKQTKNPLWKYGKKL